MNQRPSTSTHRSTAGPPWRGRVAAPLVALVALAVLGGCSGPKLQDAPGGSLDLSGDWALVVASGDQAPRRRRPPAPGGEQAAPEVNLTLPLAGRVNRLRIDQGASFIRINYGDVSIGEYNFGTASRRAGVVTGWVEGGFEVRRNRAGGGTLVERYTLEGDQLRQYVALRGLAPYQNRRLFERSVNPDAFHQRRPGQ